MKASQRAFLIFICLLSVFASSNISAQWKMIVPNLVSPFVGLYANPYLGAIHYKDGVIWAGWLDLHSSNDSGVTWQKNSLNLKGNIITDINFYDKLNGVIAVANQEATVNPFQGVYLTRDGGLTWKQILTQLHCTQVAFDGSPNIIHALSQGDFPAPTGFLHTSIDGGTTWSATWPGGFYSQCFAIAKDQSIYVLNAGDASGSLSGFISVSTDHGVTWQQSAAEVDGDSYSMCADSCDPKKLYVANEDYLGTVNNLSDLYYSTNAGNSWVSSVAFAVPYLCGGMTGTANAIYTSSLQSGIYRSTDKGVSWKNIGGPIAPFAKMSFDSRNIACVNDNMIFLLDDQGSIWETTNSGGDSLAIAPGFTDLAVTVKSLFATDSLIVCDTTISTSFILQPVGCSPPTVTKIEILGGDSLSYKTIIFSPDTIGVNFTPLFDGLNASQIVITLSDGRQKTISLGGYGIPRAPLTLVTQDQTMDTLGGTVTVPITLNGAHKPENITLVMHYDTVLKYNGSLSPTGVKLDMPGEQWKGRSKLQISNAIQNSILGYANFDVFNDSVPSQHVTFDSVTVLSAINLCEYISPALATSSISPLTGCGVISISRYLHHGEIPQFALTPNPTNGDATITSSVNLGEVEFSVNDMLGAERSRGIMILAKNSPTRISLPLLNGVYSVRIKSTAGIYDLRVVVNR